MERIAKEHLKYKIFVEKIALPHCRDYLEKNALSYELINSIEDLDTQNKSNIIFRIKKGRFLEPCPGTPSYICCGYYILSPVENCPFECTYCILQAYFNNENIIVYANIDDMISELGSIKNRKIYRIGTGEFSDSLFLVATQFYLEKLLSFFSQNNEIYLELKTKSDVVPEIAYRYPQKNLIFSFSLNSPEITNKEEGKTASIENRIKIAKEMSLLGFPLSFHFDPIIEYRGWENDYKYTIDLLFNEVKEDRILWISLGTLRFIPSLKDIAERNYPKTNIFKNEFIIGLDGKKRYFRKKRVLIYKKMLSMIREKAKNVFVYLCMENEDVWMDVFNIKMSSKKLKNLMDEIVKNEKNRFSDCS